MSNAMNLEGPAARSRIRCPKGEAHPRNRRLVRRMLPHLLLAQERPPSSFATFTGRSHISSAEQSATNWRTDAEIGDPCPQQHCRDDTNRYTGGWRLQDRAQDDWYKRRGFVVKRPSLSFGFIPTELDRLLGSSRTRDSERVMKRFRIASERGRQAAGRDR